VITTIMLNWIAYWTGSFCSAVAARAQNSTDISVPISNSVTKTGKLPTFWGNPELQALSRRSLHRARCARRLLAHPQPHDARLSGARGSGFNPEAARYGGISVARNYVYAMAISGAFPASVGARHSRLAVPARGARHQVSNIGFIGIAVALLGRTRARRRPRCAFCSERSSTGARRHAAWIERLPGASSPQPDADDPGARAGSSSAPMSSSLRLAGAQEARPKRHNVEQVGAD